MTEHMNKDTTKEAAQQAWVVFSDETDLSYLRWLKRGYRHCYLILRDAEGGPWLTFDPMLNRMEIKAWSHLPSDFDLPGWLSGRGAQIVPCVPQAPQARPSPWRLLTCVEAVKRVLGVRARGIFTPYQLCRYLKAQQANAAASHKTAKTKKTTKIFDSFQQGDLTDGKPDLTAESAAKFFDNANNYLHAYAAAARVGDEQGKSVACVCA